MSHPESRAFSVEIPIGNEKAMEDFAMMMDEYEMAMNAYETKLAQELNCSEWCASDITYLRTRSRWNQDLENELIRLDKLGKHPPVIAGWNGEPEEVWSEI